VPHFWRSLREVGLSADTLPTLSQRSAEFYPPTETLSFTAWIIFEGSPIEGSEIKGSDAKNARNGAPSLSVGHFANGDVGHPPVDFWSPERLSDNRTMNYGS
jgi:hypothetical protein